MLMANSGRKKRFGFSPFRWRQQAAKHRRFCILWINRMVNKQVEKRIAELRSEFLLMNRDLREEMSAALHEQLRQLRWTADEDYKDEEDEENSASRNMFDASGNADTSDISNDDSSQLAKCEQPPLISSDFAETSHLKESAGHQEEESSKSHANLCLGMEELRCLEEGRVQVNRTKEEILLIEKQWKEWMDKQEMKVNQKQVQPTEQQSSEKQGGAALPVSEKQMRQNAKGGETMKKMKTYLSDLFNPHASYKWERFEDED